MTEHYGFDDDMFAGSQKIAFHGFKNGDHKFRILPPFAKGKLFVQVDLHWGFTDENGKKKALKCTKWTHKNCAICDEVDKLKSEVELLKATPTPTQADKEANTALIEDKEKRISDIRKKPTYLWNILTENGEQKVLQLSWNGHDPLHQKVKFFWEQRKINVTDPVHNYLMFCSRTGLNAKTRYSYEVLEQNVLKLENLKPLIDLDKVYKETTPAELKAIVEQGFVGLPETDPNDRNFSADLPSGLGNAEAPSQGSNSTQATSTPTTESTPANTSGPSQNGGSTGPSTQTSPSSSTTTLPPNTLNAANQATADDEHARLMAMLNN